LQQINRGWQATIDTWVSNPLLYTFNKISVGAGKFIRLIQAVAFSTFRVWKT